MIIFENFIRELLRNGLIKNYTSQKEAVRNFYNNEFKSKTINSSFHLFSSDLWRYWYINHFTNKFIYFDQRWINYLCKLEKAQNPLNGKQFVENNVLDKNCCRLCMVKFPSENIYRIHKDSIKHKIRIQYLTQKDYFTQSEDLCLNIEGNDILDKKSQCTKIILEPKTNITATLHIINTSITDVEIIEIIQINPHITDLTMVVQFCNGSNLKGKESIVIVLNGYFENSTSFVFPIVIVAKYESEKEVQYILKEIEIEVKSEFSNLQSEMDYSKLEHTTVFHDSCDLIIPGRRSDTYVSYYKQQFPLKIFKIPERLQIKLRNLIAEYPSFIDRTSMRLMTNFYFQQYAKFLQIDPVMSQENYFNLLQTLVDIEEHQIQVDIRTFDTKSKLKQIEENIFELKVPGLAEARPSLLVNDSVYVKEGRNDDTKYQGIVNKVLENSVFLGFNSRFSHIFMNNKIFCIEFGYNRRTLRVVKQALFIAKEHDIVSYMYPKEVPKSIEYQSNKMLNYFNPQLNEEQKRAVKNILEVKSVPYLIFGPPGTGKTVTVVEAILQIWKNHPEAKILVCAPSNAAANEIAFRLVDKMPSTDIFRLLGTIYGQDVKILSKLRNIINTNRDGTFYMPSMEDILKYRVLLTTLVTAARIVNGGVPDGHYSHVFIDESGYSTESETLIPIAGILSNSTNRGKVVGQVILAGDPRQLGPVIHSKFVKYCGYGKSMLERLLDTCNIYARCENNSIPYDERFVTKLVKNYRSHKTILKTPNELFYHNELIPASDDLSSIFTKWKHLKTPEFPVIFHHVVGEDQREKNSPSFFNIQELEEVVEYVSKLIGDRVEGIEITQENIGIITPYRKQAEMIHKACEKKNWKGILVGSVEQFQGKEKLIIIISTVRSKNTNKFEEIDKKCQLGFLRNPKRFNVALTRAKALLIVIGNGHALKTDKYWLHFIEYCVNNKSVAGKTFNLSNGEYLDEEIPAGNACGKREE